MTATLPNAIRKIETERVDRVHLCIAALNYLTAAINTAKTNTVSISIDDAKTIEKLLLEFIIGVQELKQLNQIENDQAEDIGIINYTSMDVVTVTEKLETHIEEMEGTLDDLRKKLKDALVETKEIKDQTHRITELTESRATPINTFADMLHINVDN